MTLLNKCHLAKTSYSAGIADRRASQNLTEDVIWFFIVFYIALMWFTARPR